LDPLSDPSSGEPPPRVPISIERSLAALAMAALCVITFANVVVRYFTSYSFAFTEEYSIFLMVVMTFLAASAAFAADRHIRLTLLVDRFLPPGPRRGLELCLIALCALMFGLLVHYGARMVWDDWRFETTSAGLGVPQWIYSVWLPILSGVIVLRLLGRALRVFRAR